MKLRVAYIFMIVVRPMMNDGSKVNRNRNGEISVYIGRKRK